MSKLNPLLFEAIIYTTSNGQRLNYAVIFYCKEKNLCRTVYRSEIFDKQFRKLYKIKQLYYLSSTRTRPKIENKDQFKKYIKELIELVPFDVKVSEIGENTNIDILLPILAQQSFN